MASVVKQAQRVLVHDIRLRRVLHAQSQKRIQHLAGDASSIAANIGKNQGQKKAKPYLTGLLHQNCFAHTFWELHYVAEAHVVDHELPMSLMDIKCALPKVILTSYGSFMT